MANIFVSIPILGKPELKMMYSLYQSIFTCREHQIRLYFNENDSLISRVRNSHISVFLNEYTDCDYFMSLDSDLEIINCYPTNNIFTKLISHNLEFVGGIYALKKDGPPRSSSIPEDRIDGFKFDSGLREMRWLSTGCWMLKRSAVEKMVKAYPELTYDGDDNMAGKKLHGLYIPFLKEIEHEGATIKKYLSEDWSFCDRWKNIGGKIFADTSIVLKHIGKHAYSMWNVEVVSKKQEEMPKCNEDVQAEKKEPVEPKVEKPKPNVLVPSKRPFLPPAGFDLIKE